MTREDIDNIRSNSALMTKIAEKISQLERVIKDRGETFTRTKEISELRSEYKLLDTAETRQRLFDLLQTVHLTPTQKIIFYEYYFIGKTAKEIASEMYISIRIVYDTLFYTRKAPGIVGKCRKNQL